MNREREDENLRRGRRQDGGVVVEVRDRSHDATAPLSCSPNLSVRGGEGAAVCVSDSRDGDAKDHDFKPALYETGERSGTAEGITYADWAAFWYG
jgi:hypothetical protein